MSGFPADPANVLEPNPGYTVLFSEAEKLNFVLKKVLGVPNTRPEDTDSMFRELPRPSRFAVFADQVYTQAIPTDADASGGRLSEAAFGFTEDTAWAAAAPADDLSGNPAVKARRFTSAAYPHVARYTQVPLQPAYDGCRQAFASALLRGAIPATLADVYTPAVYDATGTAALSVSVSPYILDGDAGILTFYDNAAAPVDAARPPRASFFRYEGARGLAVDGSGGSGGGGAIWARDASSGTVFYTGAAGVAINKAAAGAGVALDVSGDLVATVIRAERSMTLSDRRLKDDVAPLGGGVLDRVLGLTAYRYRLARTPAGAAASPPPLEIGLMAQDVEAAFPEVVVEGRHGYKMLQYDRLTAVLVEAVKEQAAQVAALRAQVARLEAAATATAGGRA